MGKRWGAWAAWAAWAAWDGARAACAAWGLRACISAAAAAVAIGCSAATPDSHQVLAPEFELPALDGGTVRLSDHIGKHAVLLTFWETRCNVCMRQMPVFADLLRDHGPRGLRVLAISVDGPHTRSHVEAAAARWDMAFPVLFDEDTMVIHRYNPRLVLPYTLLLDRRGRVVMRLVGRFVTVREPWLDAVVERALSTGTDGADGADGAGDPAIVTGDDQPWVPR